jgi:hypothetical protein
MQCEMQIQTFHGLPTRSLKLPRVAVRKARPSSIFMRVAKTSPLHTIEAYAEIIRKIRSRMIEYEMRDRNPNVPWTLEEIASDAAACRCAGAAIVHFHARTPDGAPEPRVDITKEIIRRLRESSDILIGPALGSVNRQWPAAHHSLQSPSQCGLLAHEQACNFGQKRIANATPPARRARVLRDRSKLQRTPFSW